MTKRKMELEQLKKIDLTTLDKNNLSDYVLYKYLLHRTKPPRKLTTEQAKAMLEARRKKLKW